MRGRDGTSATIPVDGYCGTVNAACCRLLLEPVTFDWSREVNVVADGCTVTEFSAGAASSDAFQGTAGFAGTFQFGGDVLVLSVSLQSDF